MTIWSTLGLAVAMLGLFGFAGEARAGEMPKVGDDAPDFSLVGSDGKTYKLADFKGKEFVVVAWFPKAFTGGCTAECKSLRASSDSLRKFRVAYFTASCDDVKTNTDFAKSLELDYPILSDPTGATAGDYGLLKPGGKNPARVTFYIDLEGKIARVDSKVNTGQHGPDVAKALEELKVRQRE